MQNLTINNPNNIHPATITNGVKLSYIISPVHSIKNNKRPNGPIIPKLTIYGHLADTVFLRTTHIVANIQPIASQIKMHVAATASFGIFYLLPNHLVLMLSLILFLILWYFYCISISYQIENSLNLADDQC